MLTQAQFKELGISTSANEDEDVIFLGTIKDGRYGIEVRINSGLDELSVVIDIEPGHNLTLRYGYTLGSMSVFSMLKNALEETDKNQMEALKNYLMDGRDAVDGDLGNPTAGRMTNRVKAEIAYLTKKQLTKKALTK